MTRARTAAVTLAFAALPALCACTRDRANPPPEAEAGTGASNAPANVAPAGTLDGFSAPIAAAHRPSGDVIAVGLDVAAKGLRAVRIVNGKVAISRIILDDVAWSSEADIKLLPRVDGVAVVWRGKRNGALVREMIAIGERLEARSIPKPVGAAFCSTRDAFLHVSGGKVSAAYYLGGTSIAPLPGGAEAEATIACGASRGFVLLEGDEETRAASFGESGQPDLMSKLDIEAGVARPIDRTLTPRTILRERDFGKDEARERADITIGDELAVVRLSAAGALAIRETKNGEPGPLHKLRTTIRQEHDVVMVDASTAFVLVVFTEDAGEACPDKVGPWTKVKALRVDLATYDEKVVDLSDGACGRELGPFTIAHMGPALSVGWLERVPTQGRARAPIAGFSHAKVTLEAASKAQRVDVAADALVDAGCNGSSCWSVALTRGPDNDVMKPGTLKVLRYAP